MFAASKTAGAVSAAPPASSDPQFNYVSLLLNDTGTNGQQNNTFLDSSSNNFTITRNGTPTQGSVTPYWPDGQWSNQFSGSGQYLTVPYSTAMLPQSGTNFTAECWVYLTGATAAFQFILGMNSSTQANWAIKNENGTLQGSIGNAFGNFGPAVANTWVHLAIVQNNNTLVGYLNGVQSFSQAITSWTSTSLVVSISARSSAGDRAFPGYVSNVRIVKGTALYTSNFTPSTTPLTAVSGTSLLTCQSNRFKDNSSNNFAITVTGTPTVQAFEPFEPASSYATSVGGSGYFDGASDYVQAANDTAFNLTSGDWTLDGWFYALAWKSGDTWIFGKDGQSGVTYEQYCVHVNSSRKLVGAVGSGASGSGEQKVVGTTTIPLNTWNYYRFVKSGTTLYLFLNGVLETSATQTFTMTHGTYPLRVGGQNNTTNCDWNGYLSDIRIVKGTALSTTSFTPPTSPVTAITGTSLLLNCTNAGIYDAATLNDLVTVGNAQVSTAQAKFGSSSMAFDGTGDYLTTPNASTLLFGTGDFTIESWVYMTTVSYECGIVSKGASSTGWSFGVNASTTNRLFFLYGTSNLLFTSGIPQNTWTHVAITRSGSTVRAFINGVQDATTGTISTSIDDSSILRVGEVKFGTRPLNGYIDDLRITKGYARYTANFTPPTAPFPTR